MRAAGATIHYCPIDRDMQLDPTSSSGCAERPQPGRPLRHSLPGLAAADAPSSRICAAAARCCWSRIARCRCSASRRPAARHASATGRCSASTRPCRCRTARCSCRTPMPLELARAPAPAPRRRRRRSLGRTAELMVQRMRGRVNGDRRGAAVGQARRGPRGRRARRAARQRRRHRLQHRRTSIWRMSPVSTRLLRRFDFDGIRRSAIENYRRLAHGTATARSTPVLPRSWPTGCARCSSRSLVPTSTPPPRRCGRAASTRSSSGTTASTRSASEMPPNAVPARRTCWSCPIHQDLTLAAHRITWHDRSSSLDLQAA